jgi:PIH1 N-terminal domain
VWDVTMHPEAFLMVSKQPRLLNTMVESAMEHVERTNQVKLERKFSRPKMRFKSTPGNPEKPAVTVRGFRATLASSCGMMSLPVRR